MTSTETSDISEVVQDQSVTRIATRIVPREDNAHDDGQEQQEQEQRQAPLGVELTGYRLLTTSVIFGIGIPKAVYSYSGQALVSTTLDWVAGVILALVLYWLGVIEAERPESSPLFFQTDLAPPILNFLSRPEAQLWFLSIIPLLLSLTQLRAMLDPGRYDQNGIPAHLLKDGLTLAVLAFSVAIFNFCLQILRVVWPRGFKGTVHHFLLFAISNAMYMAYFVFMMMKVLTRGSDYPRSIAKIAMHNTLWLYPFTLMPLSERSHDNYGVLVLAGLLPLPPRHRLIMIADVVLLEALLLGFWGLPDFPEGLYGTFFLSCVMVFLLGVFGNTHSLVTFQNGHN